MFWSSTIIRELALNLAKVTSTLRHSVKLRHYLLCSCVAACHGMVCVLYAVQNAQHTTHTPHNVFFKLINVCLLVSELYIYPNARCNEKKILYASP